MATNLNNLEVDSEISSGAVEEDLENYKGVHHQQPTQRYFCPVTGAHFNGTDLKNILESIRQSRGDPDCY